MVTKEDIICEVLFDKWLALNRKFSDEVFRGGCSFEDFMESLFNRWAWYVRSN